MREPLILEIIDPDDQDEPCRPRRFYTNAKGRVVGDGGRKRRRVKKHTYFACVRCDGCGEHGCMCDVLWKEQP